MSDGLLQDELGRGHQFSVPRPQQRVFGTAQEERIRELEAALSIAAAWIRLEGTCHHMRGDKRKAELCEREADRIVALLGKKQTINH